MIYVKISGGLGNQMFQFATAFAKAKSCDTKISIDLTEINIKDGKVDFTYRDFELESIFNISNYFVTKNKSNFIVGNSIKDKIIRKFVNSSFLIEKDLRYDKKIIDLSKNSYLEGYFQSELYFKEFEKEIRNQFTFKAKKNKNTLKIVKDINNSKSIAIHIRRGDYISNKSINNIHGTCSLDYYLEALKHFDLNNFQIYFFSDDIEWVKSNFLFLDQKKCNFIDWNSDKESWQDMYIMSKCENFIIANSSFSWWGAWLSTNKNKKIIAPKKWFNDHLKNEQTKDLIPASWVLV